jgi:hypothetical protein
MFFLLHGVMMTIPEVAVEVEAARPACERGIIYRTPEVESTERALRWGLVAFVSSTRRTVSCAAAMAAIVERIPELEGRFSMHRFWPTDLLLVFDSRANRDVLLIASTNPFEGRDFTLRFGVWNRQLQATRRRFCFCVHLELVGIPPIAWNLDTARCILGSFGWVERSDTTNRADLGTFCNTAWTDNLAGLPRSKQLWLAVFDDDSDDLPLPVEALIVEEVALLDYDTTVHIVRVEDTCGEAGRPSAGGGQGPDPGGDSGGRGNGGGRGPPPDDHRRPPDTRAGAAPAAAPARRWRGGAERRVALGHTTSVRPWPLVVDRVDAPPDGHVAATAQLVPPLVRMYNKGLGRTQGLDVEKLAQAAMNAGTMGEDCTFPFSGQGLSLPSSGGHDIYSSSAWIQSGNPKAWMVRDEALDLPDWPAFDYRGDLLVVF